MTSNLKNLFAILLQNILAKHGPLSDAEGEEIKKALSEAEEKPMTLILLGAHLEAKYLPRKAEQPCTK